MCALCRSAHTGRDPAQARSSISVSTAAVSSAFRRDDGGEAARGRDVGASLTGTTGMLPALARVGDPRVNTPSSSGPAGL